MNARGLRAFSIGTAHADGDGMLPRMIEANSAYFVTCRTLCRTFFFRPDERREVENVYWYATATMAKRHGILIHATQVLSTHIHEVLTDVRGTLPAFLRDRNRLVANTLKALLNWGDSIFERAAKSCVELYGVEAIKQKIGYTLANCVEAGLVKHHSEWPGASASVHSNTKPIIATRPRVYFSAKSKKVNWPETIELTLTMPTALVAAHGEHAAACLSAAVDQATKVARALAKQAGHVVGAVQDLVLMPFTRRATTPEPVGARNPTFAAGGVLAEAWRARTRRREFLCAYRRAFEALKNGRDAVFPLGTWRWTQELKFPRRDRGLANEASGKPLATTCDAVVFERLRRTGGEGPTPPFCATDRDGEPPLSQ